MRAFGRELVRDVLDRERGERVSLRELPGVCGIESMSGRPAGKDEAVYASERLRCGSMGGRPRRYDLSGFSVGQSITLPWRKDFAGNTLRKQEALHQGVRREERRLGQTFSRMGKPMGLVVTRTA